MSHVTASHFISEHPAYTAMSTSSSQSSSTLDGLPKQFVTAMRTLFDIMDDKRLGCVNVADIEARWQDDGSKGLPKGVIESLRKVTPPNGQLSFERFCAGLKICLLRNQVENQRGGNRVNGIAQSDPTATSININPSNRPPSAPLLSFSPPPPPPPPLSTVPLLQSSALPSHNHHTLHQQHQRLHNDNNRMMFNSNNNNTSSGVGAKNHLNLVHHSSNLPPQGGKVVRTAGNTAAIRPNVVSTNQRTLSMPQLVSTHANNPSLLKDTNTNQQQIIQPPADNIQHHHRKSSYDSLNSKLIPMSKPPPSTNQQQQQLVSHVNPQQQQQSLATALQPLPVSGVLYGPPKPPRAIDRVNNGGGSGGGAGGGIGFDREGIRTALQNWQLGIMVNNNERDQVDLKHLNNTDNKPSQGQQQPQPYAGLLRTTTNRSLGDGSATNQQYISDMNSAINNLNHLNLIQQPNNGMSNNTNSSSSGGGQGIYQKKGNVRRREPRRHTLQNGIDYNMLKRMKQIEQEKEVLIGGLNAIEKARDWYMKQIAVTQDKMKYLGRMGHVEHWSEAQQERLELQRARVLEVNRHLAALTDSWERGGLPLHMNLAVQHLQQPVHPLDCANRLKQQNRLLTEEVGKKTERISILEREKQSLIRELLQNRVPNRNSQEEAVF